MTPAPVSLGYLTPQAHRFRPAAPEITYGSGLPVVNGEAAEWDYNADVLVVWGLAVDLPGLLADCGLREDTRIHAVISWHSTWTNFRGAGEVTRIADGDNTLTLKVPGGEIGGVLNLGMTVTLGAPGRDPAAFAPTRPGSPLWAQRATVTLEGSAARMPVMAVDFAATGRGREHGMWQLECDHDLNAATTGALLLYVNSSHVDVRALLDRPDDPLSISLARFIAADVTRQLVLRALQHDELDDGQNYESGTLGDLFISLLRTHLPGRALHRLRREFADDPGEIEAELLSRSWETVS